MSENVEKFKIIIIDDDIGIIESLKSLLPREHHIEGYTSSLEGIERIKEESFDLLVLDYYIDAMNDGKKVINAIRKFNKNLYILLLTGHKDTVPGLESLKSMDIQHYCEKSSDFENIIIAIESAVKSIEFLGSRTHKEEDQFKDRLKWLRIKSKVSQETLSEYLGVKRSTVASYETGNSEPSFEVLRKIAHYFGVSTDFLLGYSLDNIKK